MCRALPPSRQSPRTVVLTQGRSDTPPLEKLAGFQEKRPGIGPAIQEGTGDAQAFPGKERTMETKKTIAETLRDLQVQTGAQDSFVTRVESELLSRGVLLDGDAAPYEAALREAFLRDLCQREDPRFIRNNANHLQAAYNHLRSEHDEIVEKLEEVANALRRYVRFESDTMAYDVVPGPEMIQ
jgi:hypothetical protein